MPRRHPPETFTCAHCTITFVNAARRQRQKFCSPSCAAAAQRLPPEVNETRARQRRADYYARNRENQLAKTRAWTAANPEKKRAASLRAAARRRERRQPLIDARKAEREAGAEARAEKQRASKRARYEATRDRDREKNNKASQAWRAANPGRSQALQREWRLANADKVRAAKRLRRAGKRIKLVHNLFSLQRGRCAYCREKLGADRHVDHIMPLAKGGPDRRDNLQLTCSACNLKKNAKHPIDFARSLGRLL